MKIKIVMIAVAAVMAEGTFATQPANTARPCRTWVDPVLRVQFPERLGGLQMTSRHVYNSGDDDYSLRYDSDESRRVAQGGWHLDIYIYTRAATIPDGAGDEVMEEMSKSSSAVTLMHPNAKASEMFVEGMLPRAKLKYLWTSHTFNFEGHQDSHQSITWLTAWRNRFIKLRCSRPAAKGCDAPCEELPKDILPILNAFDALLADAMAAAKVDIYAIANPTNALVALRRKWLGVDARVPMVEMPDYEDRFFELDDVQDWCSDDMEKRAVTFERVAREGLRLKIEPDIWYYNLACALARQKKADDAFEALEQAIVAGFNCAEHMREDADLKSIREDVRFKKLAAIAETITENRKAPRKFAKVVDGGLSLDEDNVYYAFKDRSYWVVVETDIINPIIYLDHNEEHCAPPDGMIGVNFTKEFRDARRDVGSANIHFEDARTGAYIPVVLASDCVYEEDRLNKPMSIPAHFGLDSNAVRREGCHFGRWNTLGIYTAGSDYGIDGIDRFIGYFPGCIAHTGGAEDAAKFVQLYREIVQALSVDVREDVPVVALNIIRRAQKCVTDEATFMSGIAQRPVMTFDDIDVKKAMAMACTNVAECFPDNIPRFIADARFSDVETVRDIWISPRLSSSLYHQAFVAAWGEKTKTFEVAVVSMRKMVETGFATNGWRYVWKVLQGDEKKVRIKAANEDSSKVRIGVDNHAVFDAPLANGKTIKTSRVDVGCFLLNEHGAASIPAIVSVYFSPNETREYDVAGKLVSIDYTKRQLKGWRPQLCAKGAWKDTFHYAKDGRMTGWMRVTPDENGGASTNEFTREGLVVMTRDALGRPKDVRRDMKMRWMQDFCGEDFTGDEYDMHTRIKGIKYDDDSRAPEETTLAWRYMYQDDKDLLGKPSPKPFRPFAYRPELCRRANFTEISGFRFPLYDQMMAGHAHYALFKYGLPEDGDWLGLMREDSPLALKTKGLTPPKTLKKMEFCPWKPSTNDLWRVDIDDTKDFIASNLVELADGACRLHSTKQGSYLSVRETYTLVNDGGEHCAYTQLDKTYRRGGKIKLSDDKTVVTDGDPLKREELPKGVENSMAYWHLPNAVLFCITARHNSGFAARSYIFSCDVGDLPEVSFQELPSRAIGNTVMSAFVGEADAMNNLAVLLYAEVANSGEYKEARVIDLLKRAAEKGCETANRNLDVLRYNRGEDVSMVEGVVVK